MWQLLSGKTEILIYEGFIYVPLCFDPEIAAELDAAKRGAISQQGEANLPKVASGPLLAREGGYFIRSLSLQTLVENYQAVFPEEYEARRTALLREMMVDQRPLKPLVDETLRTILFEVFPYFLRRRPLRRRGTRDAGEVLAGLAEALPGTPTTADYLGEVRQQEATLRERLQWLTARQAETDIPPVPANGGAALLYWWQSALRAHILSREIVQQQQKLAELQKLWQFSEPQLTLLLTIAARGEVEIDGVGLCRDPKQPGTYWVYKKTGAYVLQDYFGRPYLFPDCRVAVATSGPFRPVVLETYKHPLLRRFAPRQPICLTDYQPPAEFSATAVIRALQEGVNALFYGYNSRKRNGYNSLDAYGRHLSGVNFEDWRLPMDDPRLAAGELEVKNR